MGHNGKITAAEIERRFETHAVGDKQRDQIVIIRAAFKEAATKVVKHVPDGREQALVLTKLEEASFYAVAGIARPST
jgi:hypothetical protein